MCVCCRWADEDPRAMGLLMPNLSAIVPGATSIEDITDDVVPDEVVMSVDLADLAATRARRLGYARVLIAASEFWREGDGFLGIEEHPEFELPDNRQEDPEFTAFFERVLDRYQQNTAMVN